MTSDLERRYRRSLSAYPSAWRAENAEIVLGTLLDVADAEGRDRPARGERLSLGIDGAAHRLDRRVAIGAAVVAFAASVLGAVHMLFFAAPMAELGLWWVAFVFQIVVTIAAVVTAAAALLRSAHRIGSRSALTAVVLSLPAAGAAFVAVTLWAVAFDAADAGRPVSATQNGLMIGCLIGSVVLGSVVVGLLSRPLFPPASHRPSVERSPRSSRPRSSGTRSPRHSPGSCCRAESP